MKIVFTNGAFDCLHRGHIASLREAAEMGDWLIVGLNSDQSVSRLKGPTRPIQKQADRKSVLENLKMVDRVIVFDEPDVCNLLSRFKPDVWAKGGSYTLETLNQEERRIAEELGIEIRFLSMVEGVSTTKMVEQMR